MTNTFVLAIDHRNSLRHWYAGLNSGGTEAVTTALSSAKVLVAEALLAAAASKQGKQGEPMLLIDEEYGGGAIAAVRAGSDRIKVIVPAERSGQPEFIFEHGDDFGAHIEASGADIVKALVRYNPSGDAELNARSRTGLLRLADWLDAHDMPFMLELLVPPTAAQRADTDFDTTARPGLTRDAIAELRQAGLSPAFWKVEGQPSTAEFASLSSTAGGHCLVLGRGEDAEAVDRWVAMAAAAPGFSGFAVGRTIWAGPLGEWLTGTLSRADAVAAICASYLHFTGIYLKNSRE